MPVDVDIDVDLLRSEIQKTYARVSDEPAHRLRRRCVCAEATA
jgi:hypothetical protein